MKKNLYYVLLWLLPKNIASAFVGFLVSLNLPKTWTAWLIKGFIKVFGVNVAESKHPIEHFKSLQQFFIRELNDNARPINQEENSIVSPADGVISQEGVITNGKLIQAKGRTYSVLDLVKDQALADTFADGHFFTLYLSPKDYHRFHMPLASTISETIFVPGALWPVNRWAVDNVENLFAVNERTITKAHCQATGLPFLVIAVGACMVGKIELNYLPTLKSNPWPGRFIPSGEQQIIMGKGQELGKFMFGSTIILLFSPGFNLDVNVTLPQKIQMGEKLAIRR